MKKDSIDKIRLGAFVAIGITIFILAIFLIGQQQRLFVSTINVNFVCTDVNGLQAGNKVRFSGIDIGTVGAVEIISDTAVRVELLIERRVKKFIKKDAQAVVGSEGLMGDKVVNVTAGTPGQKEIENNDKIVCMEGNSMEEIMKSINVVAKNAATITGDLASISGNIREGKGSIGKLLMDTSVADNLNKALVNVKEGAGGFKQTMDAAQNNFLLKGYFKKKEREKEKVKEDKQKAIDKQEKQETEKQK